MKKRIISLILAVVMLVVCFPIAAGATTNGITRSQAVLWVMAQANAGNVVGPGEAYGECVGLIKAYFSYMGVLPSNHSIGVAANYANPSYDSRIPSGWIRCYTSAGYVPQIGDIAVWGLGVDGASKTTGHCAIVVDVSGNLMAYVEQNGTAGRKCAFNYLWFTVYGFTTPEHTRIFSISEVIPATMTVSCRLTRRS